MLHGPSGPLEARRAALKRRRKLPEPVRRQEATQATADKFMGKPMDWSIGRHCIKMGHYHLRQMGWRAPKLPKLPHVKSPLAAKKAMKERGWESISDMLDSILERIPPAMMHLGDFAVTPGDEGFDSLMINLGPRRMMGFLPAGLAVQVGEGEDAELRSEVVVAYEADYSEFTAAWRVR